MKIDRSWIAILSFLWFVLPTLTVQAYTSERITIRIQVGDRPPSYARALDSSGVVFVAIEDFASILGHQYVLNRERRKIELRLPAHRVKATAWNPYLVITEAAANASSVYQLSRDVLFVDSLYYVEAAPFIGLVQRVAAMGISYDPGVRTLQAGSAAPPPRFDITGIDYEQRLNGSLLIIKSARPLGDFEAFLKADGWLFVTIANAVADTFSLNRTKPQGTVRRIVTFQSPTSVQLTFRVAPDVVRAEPFLDERTNNLLIALHTKSEIEKAELERKRQEQLRERLEQDRNRAKLDVIVIDAGHGGKDPGTIGVGGTREKDVTLAIALKLGRLIERNMKDVKVVYTRKSDEFVELYRRTQIANEVGGKLFISIHCNSTERKPSPANGFEIYLLGPGKTDNAIRIAERENSVIKKEVGYAERYRELTEEDFILVTLRQSAFTKYSERFAEIAAEAMANQLKIKNSGVKQAGFYVLVGASMPNVLVETGYLSNRQEERVLRSADGQRRIAEALFEGIKEFKLFYEHASQEGRSAGVQGP